jgi:hypothetical protein
MELLCAGGRRLIGGRGSSRVKREVRLQFLDPDARADRPETTPSPPSRPNPPSSSLLKQHNNNNNNRMKFLESPELVDLADKLGYTSAELKVQTRFGASSPSSAFGRLAGGRAMSSPTLPLSLRRAGTSAGRGFRGSGLTYASAEHDSEWGRWKEEVATL